MITFLAILAIFLGLGLILALVGLFWLYRRSTSPATDPSQAIQAQLVAFEERMRERFKVVASEALQDNQAHLLTQAQLVVQNAQNISASELQKQGLELQKSLSPLQQSLAKLEGELKNLENARVGAYAGLNEQLKEMALTQRELKAQAGNLVQALRAPQARGAWGELQLKRAVEFAGMTAYVDFQEQVSRTTDDARLRPDMIVRLPNGRSIVVDAKVPMAAYLNALDTQDPDQKRSYLADHARQLKSHFRQLGQKNYFLQFNPSPEFVVLFLHNESLLSAALEQDGQLIEDALREKVIIATPTTLIALLKAVAYGWGESQAADKARTIVALGQELFDRVGVVTGYWQRVGDSLDKAVQAYNQAATSTESRLLVTARKLSENTTLKEISPISSRPIAIAIPESKE